MLGGSNIPMSKSLRLSPFLVPTLSLLMGCTALPSFGPSDEAVISGAQNKATKAAPNLAYDLIDISPSNVQAQGSRQRKSFHGSILNSSPSATTQRLATGDVLKVNVWEPTDDGLFATAGKRSEEMVVVVDSTGHIDLPYIDEIPVRGQTIAKVSLQLTQLYSKQAINPEVQVSVVETDAKSVSILGNIRDAGRIELPLRGVRLLDLIAEAGGVTAPDWEIHVSVTRKSQVQSVRYDDILANIHNNVRLLPDDIVQVSQGARMLSVFGAVKSSGSYNLDKPVPTVLDLLGAAGGLNDAQAEPRSIFVYRPVLTPSTDIPTVFRFDLRRADSFFLGSAFALREGDVTYVATADASDFQKFLTVIVRPIRSVTN